MEVIDRGGGPPLVLIPGLQGRWEYMRPTVDALSASFRVLTFSLDDVTGAGSKRTRPTADLSAYADAVAAVLDDAGVERATICGVSFGGLIAVRFAARHAARCGALVLASTPRSRLRLKPRHQMYLRAPWILGPLFLAETPFRLRPELVTAIPDAKARRAFSLRSLRTVVAAPISLSKMAGRARMISIDDVTADCAHIAAPTLIITGESHLDHVVPVDGSSEYLRLIPNARAAVLERTGHLGSITRPETFAAIVRAFTLDVGAGGLMPPRDIAGPAGRLEAILEEPAAAGSIGRDGRVSPGHPGGLRAAVVFAHPLTSQGGTMHTKVVYQAAKALSRIGCAVLRFNFRGAGASQGTFSDGPGEQDDFRAALDYMAAQYPGAPLWSAGMSFGAWVALSVGAEDPRVSALIGIAPPVTHYDFSAVERSAKPKFFIQGEFDEICFLKDMRAFYARAAEPKELVVIDAADHLFDGKVAEVADAIEDLLGDWSG